MKLKRRQLILHVGLPKTGSSALQRWCYQNRQSLRAQNVQYLDVLDNTLVPKHQYAVDELRTGDFSHTARQLSLASEDRLVLSSEGLTNQLSFFAAEHVAGFRKLISQFDVMIVIVSRNKEKWLRSYYKQSVINPPVGSNLNATSLTFDEFAAQERPNFIHSLAEDTSVIADAFGATEVHTLRYEGDWFAQWKATLGVNPDPTFELPRENTSIPDEGVEFVRQLNGYAPNAMIRNGLMKAIEHVWHQNHNVFNSYRNYPDLLPTDIVAARDCLSRLPVETPFATNLRSQIDDWLDSFSASVSRS